MPDLDLVFDFDGWKLNGVYIFSEPSAFAFLGVEDTPATETVLQPGLLERMKAGLTGRKAQGKRIVQSDDSLVYQKYGLWLDYEGDQIYEFDIYIQTDNDINSGRFPGRFVFGAEPINLSGISNLQNIKDIFGKPDEEDDEFTYLSYSINNYELDFWFDENQNLESIKGSLLDLDAAEETEES
jgi:hypothetical protein